MQHSSLLIVPLLFGTALSQSYMQPEQIHLSYPDDPSQMWVTWVTLNDTKSVPVVEYGKGKLDTETQGQTTAFTDGGSEKRKIFVHRVLLKNLTPGQTYVYHAGSKLAWSSIYYFTTIKSGTEWSPRFAVYGDFGNKNAQSLGRLQQATQRGNFDMILHVGDIAYNMDDSQGMVGDQFMRQIEPIAAYVPYMVTVGNHEYAYNFSHFVNRFTMPGNSNNFFYSFDIGPAHIIGFSTEFYYFTEYGWLQIARQFQWLEEDLKKANANRKNVPWIITNAHRPMYCSNWDSDDCTKFESLVRAGLPLNHMYALEPLFYKYGVDLSIWAHEHSYERLWPVYNRTVYNGSGSPYVNPPAPVHIITGSSGCQENTDGFKLKYEPWSAFRSSEYGFSEMTILNGTHLHWKQISDDQDGKVIDDVMLIKEKHGVYDEEVRANADGIYVPLDMEKPAGAKRCENCNEL